MAVKNRGISVDLLIHPGETISDLLVERCITQKELAKRAGVSEAFLSDVINGKKDISKGLAVGLEYAFDLPKSFWLNLQANYDAERLSLMEEESIQEEERIVLSSLHEIVSYLVKQSVIPSGLTQEEIILSLRKIFKISNLTGLGKLAPSGAFRMSNSATVNPSVLGAWLCLCQNQCSDRRFDAQYDPEKTDELIGKLKEAMQPSRKDLQKTLQYLFAQYGIDFSIVHNFRGAPVQGYIARRIDSSYQMVLTLRGAFADIFWFSLFHELGHIVNGDISKGSSYIDTQYGRDEKRENEANSFAARALLEQRSYELFVEQNDFTYRAICEYAQSQGVPPFVVIGRLQKDKLIPWTWYQKYKPRYKWAE